MIIGLPIAVHDIRLVGVLASKVSSQWGVVAAIVTGIHDEGDEWSDALQVTVTRS
jgi:hypothetical protein